MANYSVVAMGIISCMTYFLLGEVFLYVGILLVGFGSCHVEHTHAGGIKWHIMPAIISVLVVIGLVFLFHNPTISETTPLEYTCEEQGNAVVVDRGATYACNQICDGLGTRLICEENIAHCACLKI